LHAAHVLAKMKKNLYDDTISHHNAPVR